MTVYSCGGHLRVDKDLRQERFLQEGLTDIKSTAALFFSKLRKGKIGTFKKLRNIPLPQGAVMFGIMDQ